MLESVSSYIKIYMPKSEKIDDAQYEFKQKKTLQDLPIKITFLCKKLPIQAYITVREHRNIRAKDSLSPNLKGRSLINS